MESPKANQQKTSFQNKKENKNIDQIISTLQKQPSWSPQLNLYHYEGFYTYEMFLKGIITIQQTFEPKPTDVILCSAPKTGTTWLKALTFAIATRKLYTNNNDSINPLLVNVPHDCVPFLEVDIAQKNHKTTDRTVSRDLPLLATHVPYASLPKSISSGKSSCKIVYVCRDPKDVFVSMWYFVAKQLVTKGAEVISFDDAFDRFCRGVSNYGPYLNHVLGYWEASLESPEKILFLRYEDMMNDKKFYVTKLGEFMGYPFSFDEIENGVVEKIVTMCGFESLSGLDVNKNGRHRNDTAMGVDNNVFFRKGKVGDWKNYLTYEMGSYLDFLTDQKLKGSGLNIISNRCMK